MTKDDQNLSKSTSRAIGTTPRKNTDNVDALCERCGQKGVSDSHTIPRTYLESIAEKIGAANKKVITQGSISSDDGKTVMHELEPSSASTKPLFCNDKTNPSNSCETFFSQNGESQPPLTGSSDFRAAIFSFCEKLAYANHYQTKQNCNAEQKEENFENEKETTTRILAKKLDSYDAAKETIERVLEIVKKAVNVDVPLLNSEFFGPKNFALWAAEGAKTIKNAQLCAGYIIFDKQLQWHVADLVFTATKPGIPEPSSPLNAFFIFTMKVNDKCEKKDALIFVPLIFNPERKRKPFKGSEIYDFFDSRKSELNREKDRWVKTLIAYAVTRKNAWFSPSLKEEMSIALQEAGPGNQEQAKSFNDLILENLLNPAYSCDELWCGRGSLHTFCATVAATGHPLKYFKKIGWIERLMSVLR